jgi:hypothetical protein
MNNIAHGLNRGLYVCFFFTFQNKKSVAKRFLVVHFLTGYACGLNLSVSAVRSTIETDNVRKPKPSLSWVSSWI